MTVTKSDGRSRSGAQKANGPACSGWAFANGAVARLGYVPQGAPSGAFQDELKDDLRVRASTISTVGNRSA